MEGNNIIGVVQPKAHVDLNLPDIVDGSLVDVVETYARLLDDSAALGQELGEHTRFALTGRSFDETGVEQRMKVQASAGNISVLRLEQTADVDSVLGFVFQGEDFPVFDGTAFFWQVLNNPSYTLDSNLHLPKHTIKSKVGDIDTQVCAFFAWHSSSFN